MGAAVNQGHSQDTVQYPLLQNVASHHPPEIASDWKSDKVCITSDNESIPTFESC